MWADFLQRQDWRLEGQWIDFWDVVSSSRSCDCEKTCWRGERSGAGQHTFVVTPDSGEQRGRSLML